MKKFLIITGILITILFLISKYNKRMNEILDYTLLPFINKVKENQKAFGEKVILICQYLGFPAQWLMVVMNNESGVNSHIKNPTSSATGLIQFMEATAKALGTTTAKLRDMSNVEQLDYVKKYFEPYKNKIHSVADVYLAVFFPLALYKDENYIFPTWASKANPIFDLNKDSILTKKEFTNYVNKKYSQYI